MLRSGIFWNFVKMIMLRTGNLGLKMGVSLAAHTQYGSTVFPPPRVCGPYFSLFGTGPGGGGVTVAGTCRWTGYDFPVITIDTGYLNRPNWLLAGYSVYHRVASQPGSQPTMFMSGPRSRHQRRDGACGTQQIFMNVWWYTAEYRAKSVRTSTNKPWINAQSRNSLPLSFSLSQGMHMKVFSKVYCDRVFCVCAQSGLRQGQVPPPPSGTAPLPSIWKCPPPPSGFGTGPSGIAQMLDWPVRHWTTAIT